MPRVLATLAMAAVAATGVRADYTAPNFVIDLSAPPQQRWTAAVTSILQTYGYNATFGAVMNWVEGLIPLPIWELAEPILEEVGNLWLGEYGQEMQGVYAAIKAAAPNATITYGQVVAMNLVYDLSAACTSIVADLPPSAGGTVIHARNLDYPISGLNELVATVDFVPGPGSSPLFRGVTFIGYVGLLTGMRPGGWAVSVDEREYNGTPQPIWDIILNLEAALQGGHPIGIFLRTSLASLPTYGEALPVLNSTELMAPVYLTVSGVAAGEGAVITRNRTGADCSAGEDCGWGVMQLGSAECDSPGNWYCFITNFDPWLPENTGDNRRLTAAGVLNAWGAGNSSWALMNRTLSTPPVLNNGTKYTAFMAAATNTLSAIVRM